MVAAKRGSRPGAGQLMTDLAWGMLWSTSSVAGEYEHRRTTRLINFRHRIFRLSHYETNPRSASQLLAAPIPSDII